MARIRYLLVTIFLWGFMWAWWAGVVLWVATTGAWPMGSEPAFLWPFWMGGLSVPAIAAYLSWEYLWDQEKQRSGRAEDPQIRRARPSRAKQNEEPKAASAKDSQYSGKLAEASEETSPLTVAQQGHSLNGEVAQCSLAPPSDPTPDAPAISSTAACACQINVVELKLAQEMSTPVDISTQMQPPPPIEGGDEFLDDCEKALRELMHPDQKGRIDQKGTVRWVPGQR